MDLYECDQDAISSEESIKQYAREVCQVIDMKAHGEPLTPYFGEKLEHTKGYSLLQFIETIRLPDIFLKEQGQPTSISFHARNTTLNGLRSSQKSFLAQSI